MLNRISRYTTYRKIRFRSGLEAKAAAFFDEAGIRWYYEPESLLLPSGQVYTPDFVLPDLATIVEMKGNVSDESVDVAEEFAHSHLFREFGEKYFRLWFSGDTESQAVLVVLSNNEMREVYQETEFVACEECLRPWFLPSWGWWVCPHCGHYEGNTGFIPITDQGLNSMRSKYRAFLERERRRRAADAEEEDEDV